MIISTIWCFVAFSKLANILFFKVYFSFYCFLRVAKGFASDPHDLNVGGRLKLIIVYSSNAIIWRIINSTAMTQSFWQNFAILGGATFLYPVFIMLTSAVEMSWVFFKCDWHGNIRRDEPINCMYEKLFCSMRFNATSRTKNRSTVETSNLFWKKNIKIKVWWIWIYFFFTSAWCVQKFGNFTCLKNDKKWLF